MCYNNSTNILSLLQARLKTECLNRGSSWLYQHLINSNSFRLWCNEYDSFSDIPRVEYSSECTPIILFLCLKHAPWVTLKWHSTSISYNRVCLTSIGWSSKPHYPHHNIMWSVDVTNTLNSSYHKLFKNLNDFYR